MRKIICIVTACVIIMAVFTGCGVLQKLGLQKTEQDELAPASSIVMNEEEAKRLTDKIPVHLYFANEDNTKLRVVIKYIPMSEAKKSPSNLASVIVKELIAGPGDVSGVKATMPAGTKLRSPVKIEAGVATVDFNKEFADKHPGGKAAEQMTLFSVVNSLTEMKDIQKVKFTVNGKTLKEYKGNFKFNVPFPRSEGLISKEPAIPSPVNTEDQKKENDKKADPKGDKSKETSGEIGEEEELMETDIDFDLDFIDEDEILE